MFWKKKDKDEAPAPKGKERAEASKKEDTLREEARRPEPSRAQEPQRIQPAPQHAGGERPTTAAIEATLNARRAPKGAPQSGESIAAQSRAAQALAGSGEAVDIAAGRDIAAGEMDRGFDALRAAAQDAGQRGADRWRTLGALAFNVDAGRSKFAYENLFNFQPRQFWDCIYLARLRGIGGQLDPAKEAATSALGAAGNDAERGVARCELGLIAVAGNDGVAGVEHAEAALALGRNASSGHDLVVRQVLLGDAALLAGDPPKARKAFADALDGAKRLGAAAPTDITLAQGVCEILEKCAAAAAAGADHDAASKYIEEALNIRRRLGNALPAADAQRGVAQTLNLKGELRRVANDPGGAKAAFEEGLGLVRKISEASPRDPTAQRAHWGVLWRMASTAGTGVEWRQVVSTMERMHAAGALEQDGHRFLDEARRRAAA